MATKRNFNRIFLKVILFFIAWIIREPTNRFYSKRSALDSLWRYVAIYVDIFSFFVFLKHFKVMFMGDKTIFYFENAAIFRNISIYLRTPWLRYNQYANEWLF